MENLERSGDTLVKNPPDSAGVAGDLVQFPGGGDPLA